MPKKKYVRGSMAPNIKIDVKKEIKDEVKKDNTIDLNLILSENLTLKECLHSDTANKHGIDNTKITEKQLLNGQAIATAIFQPTRDECEAIRVSSGFRCKELNELLKGSETSQHCDFEALDLQSLNGSNADIFIFIQNNLEFDQLIWEFGTGNAPEWVHVSFKRLGENRNQVLRSTKENGKTVYRNT